MARASVEIKEPFLARHNTDEEESDQGLQYAITPQSRRASWKSTLAIHGGLIFCYTVVSMVAIRQSAVTVCKNQASPVYGMIPLQLTTQPTVFHNLSRTIYAGDKPKVELDAAWDNMLEPMNMRFSEQELENVNQESIPLPKGGGYLGWFGVFHELHCVKMLRHSFDRARECNSTEAESKKDKQHVDHCIELLRQASVCRPDTSLTSFIWHPSNPKPMFNVSESVHTCVDWDAFLETTRKRVVSDEEMKDLQNPLLLSE